MAAFFEALAALIQAPNLIVMLAATLAGLLIGATPGLTVNMAVALAVPITMYMSLPAALSLILGLYVSGIYGGSVSAILINTPGTPASAATAIDGYPLSQQGEARRALGVALSASLIGGLFSIVVLILVAQRLAGIAILFGPTERAMLLLFALTMVGLLAGDSMLRGLLSALAGLLLATVGLDPMVAVPRFTFGVEELSDGFSFIPLLIGLFAVSEILVQAENRMQQRIGGASQVGGAQSWRDLLADLRTCWKAIGRSCALGTFVGILPGLGATIASFLGYGEAKRSSKHPERFGRGAIEGVAASEAANNAVTGATLVPLLALSIPGDTVTAILFGALLIQGVSPGPLLFETKLDIVFLIYLTLLLANLFMVVVGWSLLSPLAKISRFPAGLVFPVVFVFCVLGSFSIRNSFLDVISMLGFGVIGYLMRKLLIPLPPLVIGFILGLPFEEAFRQSLIASDGSPAVFVTRPVAAFLLALTLLSIAVLLKQRLRSTAGKDAATSR